MPTSSENLSLSEIPLPAELLNYDYDRWYDIRKLFEKAERIVRPARRLKAVASIEKYIKVPQASGPPVPFSFDRVPYLRGVAEAFDDPNVREIYLMGNAQNSGKTTLLMALQLAQTSAVLNLDSMLVHMTRDDARRYSQTKLERMLNASPDIAKLMHRGGQFDNVFDKNFNAGARLDIGWPVANAVSSHSASHMFATDRDRMPDDIDGEGSLESLAVNRFKNIGRKGKFFEESSPGRDHIDPTWEPPENEPHILPPVRGIAAAYNRGHRARWVWPCPHKECGKWFEASFDDLTCPPTGTPDERAAKTALTCPNCGADIGYKEKPGMNAKGKWLAEGQTLTDDGPDPDFQINSPIRSFLVDGIFASAGPQNWSQLMRGYLVALQTYEETGEELDLKTWTNTQRGAVYMSQTLIEQDEQKASDLERRVEDLPKRQIPDACRVLFATVDVQANHFVVQIHGWGPGLEGWLIDRFSITESAKHPDAEGKPEKLDPSGRGEHWDELLSVILRTYPLAGDPSRVMQVSVTACDYHGKKGTSAKAAEFYRSRIKHFGLESRFALFRGVSPQINTAIPPIKKTMPDTSGRSDRGGASRGDVPVYANHANYWKDTVNGILRNSQPGRGYHHFPNWLKPWFFKEMRSEARDEFGKWSPLGGQKRNEAFDLFYMNRALCNIVGINQLKDQQWDEPPNKSWGFILPHDQNTRVFAADSVPPPKERKSASFADIAKMMAKAG